MGLVKKIRFAAFAIQMCVRAEERRERTDPVPAHEHLRIGIAEETTDVSYIILVSATRQV